MLIHQHSYTSINFALLDWQIYVALNTQIMGIIKHALVTWLMLTWPLVLLFIFLLCRKKLFTTISKVDEAVGLMLSILASSFHQASAINK